MSEEDEALAAELAKLEAEMNEMNDDVANIEKKDVIPEVQLVPGKKLFIKEPEADEIYKGRVATYNQRIVDYPLPAEWLQRSKQDPMTTTKVTLGNKENSVGTICWTNVINQFPDENGK